MVVPDKLRGRPVVLVGVPKKKEKKKHLQILPTIWRSAWNVILWADLAC